jgi:hypothetical protein
MPVSTPTRDTLIREYQDAERTLQKLHQVEQQEKVRSSGRGQHFYWRLNSTVLLSENKG